MKPQVKITANKKIDAKAILENQKSSSYEFQQEIYKWFLKKKTQNKFIGNRNFKNKKTFQLLE